MGKGKSGCTNPIAGAALIAVPGSRPGEVFYATPGVMDDQARAAFSFGHCHSLALALHRRTGWPLLGLSRHDRQANLTHVVLEMPDGRWLDASGPQPADPQPYPGAPPPRSITEEQLLELTEQAEWLAADPQLAESFVDPLLEQAGVKIAAKA